MTRLVLLSAPLGGWPLVFGADLNQRAGEEARSAAFSSAAMLLFFNFLCCLFPTGSTGNRFGGAGKATLVHLSGWVRGDFFGTAARFHRIARFRADFSCPRRLWWKKFERELCVFTLAAHAADLAAVLNIELGASSAVFADSRA